MVKRQRIERRIASRRRQSPCVQCVALVLALSVVVGPLLWERVTSIAGAVVVKPSSSRGKS